jgi:hypothetical protein
MKKTIYFLLIVLLIAALVLTGCNAKEKAIDKLTDKVADKITEEIVGNISGGDIDLTAPKWPKADVGKLPEVEGKIVFVFNDVNMKGVTIEVEGLKLKNYEKYLEKVKAAGYEADLEMDNDGIYRFSGTHQDKSEIMLTYVEEKESLIILYNYYYVE